MQSLGWAALGVLFLALTSMRICFFASALLVCHYQHIEQLLFPFIHHQQCGESLWIVVPHSEHDKLSAVTEEMGAVRARWLQRQQRGAVAVIDEKDYVAAAVTATITACFSRVSLHAKNLFPPLSLLAKHDVQYYRVSLKAGQVLTAHGGFAHYGFNTSKCETHALASNMVTEEWLLTGGPEFLVRHFEWVKQLQELQAMLRNEASLEAELEVLKP